MKKFFIKITIFLFIISIILSVINYLYLYSDNFKSSASTTGLKVANNFSKLSDNLSVVNLGSSHGGSFLYSNLNMKGHNFGIGGQHIFYDYSILRHYSNKIEEGSTVFLPISYFTLYKSYDGVDSLIRNHIYYGFLEPMYIKEFSISDRIKYNVYPASLLGSDIFSLKLNFPESMEFQDHLVQFIKTSLPVKVIKELGYTSQYFNIFVEDSKRLFDFTDENVGGPVIPRFTIENVEKTNEIYKLAENKKFKDLDDELILKISNDRAQAFMEWINEGYPTKYKNIEEVKNIIDFCRQNNFNIVLITTPVIETFRNQFPEDFHEDFYQTINTIVEEKDVIYLDYSNHEKFRNRLELFINQDHLNDEGRMIFMETVIEDLKNHGIHIE